MGIPVPVFLQVVLLLVAKWFLGSVFFEKLPGILVGIPKSAFPSKSPGIRMGIPMAALVFLWTFLWPVA